MKACWTLCVALMVVLGCSSGEDEPPPESPLRVFTTRLTYAPDLGGLAGADAKCQLAADSAVLGGTWSAWLSTPTVNAIDRVPADEPYFLVGFTPRVFNNKANWTTLPLEPIDRGEDGEDLGCTGLGCAVWTGTQLGGTAAPGWSCNWDGTDANTCRIGVADVTDSNWTDNNSNPAVARLYCMEARD